MKGAFKIAIEEVSVEVPPTEIKWKKGL